MPLVLKMLMAFLFLNNLLLEKIQLISPTLADSWANKNFGQRVFKTYNLYLV